jgi:multisubunit Na+/H+ antiporter MnhB subunit
MLSAVGYAVSVLFIFFKAPDLALTQFVVESISTTAYPTALNIMMLNNLDLAKRIKKAALNNKITIHLSTFQH